MRRMSVILLLLGLPALLLGGCNQDRETGPLGTGAGGDEEMLVNQEMSKLEATPPMMTGARPPSGLVTVAVGDDQLVFWPYTGENYSGQASDPINVIFYGKADPREIRAALLSLDGDRSVLGLPDMPPFNCRWTDCIGGIQVAYGEPCEWSGSVIQLECGDHKTLRFHLRLFKVGDWTVAGTHFEVMIPGTSDHQVLSWELAEEFVLGDFMRSGLLDPDMPVIPTGPINASPFRVIPAVIYNELPDELKGLIGGPLGQVTEDVPIWTDGNAMVLNVAGSAPTVAEERVQDFVIEFGQMIPKPFCSSGPTDLVYVEGPINLRQVVRVGERGHYRMNFHARGVLTVTPFDPTTGEYGEPMRAHVRERYSSLMTDRTAFATSVQFQKLLPSSDPNAGQLFSMLVWNSHDRNTWMQSIECSQGGRLLECDYDRLTIDPAVPPYGKPVSLCGLE